MTETEFVDIWDDNSEESQEVLWRESEGLPFWSLLFWSLLLSLLSLANPFLTDLATNLQSQNLYAGWAMTQGQTLYAHIYGTSGLLYYMLDLLGQLAFGSLIFAAFQFVALFFAGLYAYKLAYQFLGKVEVAKSSLPIFYLLLLGLGFGGFYASIFATPLILWSLHFIAAYVADEVTDKSFMAFGAIQALTLMLEPMAALCLYGLTTLVLGVYNLISRRKARGFYQFLASLLGFSLVFYPLGYVTVWQGTFGLALSQASHLLASLSLGGHLLTNGLFYGFFFVAFGFATSLIQSSFVRKNKLEKLLQVLSSLALILILGLNLFSPEQGSYQFLLALPYAFILLILALGNLAQPRARHGHRREEHGDSLWKLYFKKNFYLPLLALVYLLAFPAVQTYLLQGAETSERETLAAYISKNVEPSEKIYAWDKTASLYQKSDHLSVASILTPTLYMDTAENALLLPNELAANPPAYLAVHKDVALLKDVETQIKDSYEEVDLDLAHFHLYRLK